MSKDNLGNKHICKGCDARFFDMTKSPAVCPKCGEEVKAPKPTRSRRAAAPEPAAAAPAPAPAAEAEAEAEAPEAETPAAGNIPDEAPAVTAESEEEEDLLADDDDDDGLIEDASDMGKEEDDVAEVLEHVDEGITDKG